MALADVRVIDLTDERGIYGEATIDEAKELDDEGIELMPIPKIKPNS